MLELKGVSMTFNMGTVNEKKALIDIDFTIEDGDFITVIGGNGAGKSTLLNVIAGVYLPEKGSVVLGGRDITRLPEHKRAKYLGRVFQDPMMGTAASMEIQENLALANRRGKIRGLGWGVGKKEKARPELLLLDEHTAALDPKTAARVLDVTEELTSGEKLTTLMITHNMKDAIRYGNRLIMMHEGRIIYDVRGEEKSKLTVADLLDKFKIQSDKMLMI